MKRLVSVVIFFVVVCGIGWWWLVNDAEDHDDKTPATHSTQSTTLTTTTLKQITIRDLILRESDKTKRYTLELQAQESSFFNFSHQITCAGVSCVVTDRGECIATLTAARAIVNRNAHVLVLQDNVAGRHKDLTIAGKNVYYNISTHVLTSDEPLEYYHPLFYGKAEKSVVDVKQNAIEMSGGVFCEFSYSAAGNNSAH